MMMRISLSVRSALLSLLPLSMLFSTCPAAQEAAELQKPKSTATSTQSPAGESESKRIKFNLDFPGGTPAELVAAIQKASRRPLNAVIPVELANTQLPPLKMEGIDVPHLFSALTLGSHRQVFKNGGMYAGDVEMG